MKPDVIAAFKLLEDRVAVLEGAKRDPPIVLKVCDACNCVLSGDAVKCVGCGVTDRLRNLEVR